MTEFADAGKLAPAGPVERATLAGVTGEGATGLEGPGPNGNPI